jgi:RNA polymerase sigma factor (sigma-70 family)
MALSDGAEGAESLFLANLGTVRKILRILARRYTLAPQDAEDLESAVMLRLIEDDYAVLRAFRGESRFDTYLTVVISMMLHDWRVSRWGRWRPSAAARRLGPLAVRVETLVHRDGYAVREVAELLRSGGEPAITEAEIHRLLASLPGREPLRMVEVGAEPLAELAAAGESGALPLERETQARRAEMEMAVSAAVERLPPADRALVRMRFWEGMMVSQIARATGAPQKPLYRRLDGLLSRLRADLERNGVSRGHVAEFFGDEPW